MHLCWSCKSPPQDDPGGPAFFCPACGAVQPPDAHASLFAVLNLPEDFAVDRAALEAAYLAAQRTLHPDRLKDRSPREQLFAEQHAMQLNAAYTTLRDPLRRGRHLLTLRGVPDASGETVQDPGILMESLSDREALADADSPEAVAALGANARQRQRAAEARVAAAFAADDLARAARELLRLGYLCKFADMIRDRQRQVRI
jgi:molecular chaperone HscB